MMKLAALFLVALAASAQTNVQRKTYGSSSTSTNHTVTFDSTPTQNNLLVLRATCDDYATNISSGWTQAASALDWTGTYIYYKVAGASEPSSVTLTIGSSTGCAMIADEWSGTAPSSPLDKTASAIGQSSPVSTGTTTTTVQADELAIAVVGLSETPAGHNVSAWNNSFTENANVATTASGTQVRVVGASRVLSATGAYTTAATITSPANNHSVGAIATFKIGGAPPPPARKRVVIAQ
jgi:hypothetical protein